MVGDPGAELSAVEDMVADWEHRGQERLARVKEVTDRVGQLSATERSADGTVSVTVDSRGLPTDITLAEEAGERPMAEVSGEIMRTLRAAQSRLPALMAQVAAEVGMAGDSVVGHLLETAESSFPTPEDPAGEPPSRERRPDEEYFDDMRIYRERDGH